MAITVPYGSWPSPITTDLMLAGGVRLSQPRADGDDLYWLEGRPLERGRNVVVRLGPDGAARDVTPPDFSARTRVHEYGGGDYVARDGVVYFANDADQRLYRQRPGETPQPLTPAAELRYADMLVDAARDRLIAVREDHRPDDREAINSLVAIPLDGGEQTTLAAGNDFYASPRLSPDGRRLAWLTWNHPNMPWDGTELWLADLAADGTPANARRVAGGPAESIFQPEWSPGGVLTFISDHSDWWNLYRLGDDGAAEPLCPMSADFGLPQWQFGMSTYAYAGPETIACTYTQDGRRVMATLDAGRGVSPERLTVLHVPYVGTGLVAAGGRVVYAGASPAHEPAIIRLDPATGAHEVLRHASPVAIDAGYLSIAQPVTFPTEGGLTAHGYFYPPRNRDYDAPAGELPPLIVTSHGGPTSATTSDLSLSRQYWTSRGFAILDVNYRGSTGYGRAYRQRLHGQWGVVDVEDCINGARWLAAQGLVDGERLIIRGGSAGGYTTLCAITFHDVFKAAASYYGISDAEALAAETHKFESCDTDKLIGPYPARRDLYVARSPIHFAHNCSAALILFQGLDDKVVPPAQSEAMFLAARAKELPVAYLAFEGEGHGFRQAATLRRTTEAELYFYSRVFDFELGEAVEAVAIENLDE